MEENEHAKQSGAAPTEPYQGGTLAERLSEAEELALAGVARYVQQCELAVVDSQVRTLICRARGEGLGWTRLQALSAVSRRTIAGWLRAEV
ncbi:hypothetical protein AB0M57_11230 [Streptomyces sp. NPDC051597]|uniref:hypothetical protein n=1 Tax=Streptomyces sp. NPDC051597 TaxID=3155049 RepID=UPI003421313A